MGLHKKIVWGAVGWICLLMVPVASMAAESGKELYYSVHIDTAGDIEEVNLKINRIRVREKIVFWKKRAVKGVGTYYKVYLGWFDEFKPARRFMQKLHEAGWKKSMAVHWFKYPPWEAQSAAKTPVQEFTLPPAPPQVEMVDRFKDNGDGTITDNKTGLMRIKNGWRIEFLAAVSWYDAKQKCVQFKLGNYDDWRLPTVKEWQSLVDRRVSSPALAEPNPFENIVTHMPYWSGTEYAYGEKHAKGGTGTRNSFTVMLYSGRFGQQSKSELAFILPVRGKSAQ